MSIVLKHKGENINLKHSSSSNLGEIKVNLKWNKNSSADIGLLSRIFSVNSFIDLDLGCLYELKNGSKGSVQALGNFFGSMDNPPYILLDGDDRTGKTKKGENLTINGSHIKDIKRILIYTYIYEGIVNWKQADGIVTIKHNNSRDIIIKLDEFDIELMMCAIAYIENIDDHSFRIEKILKFYSGHKQLDADFNWGLQWVSGRK